MKNLIKISQALILQSKLAAPVEDVYNLTLKAVTKNRSIPAKSNIIQSPILKDIKKTVNTSVNNPVNSVSTNPLAKKPQYQPVDSPIHYLLPGGIDAY